jgi:hypothetical protein
MNRRELGRLTRLLRHRARLTQAELAERAAIGRWKVVDLEADRLSTLRLGEIERCLAVLDARLILSVSHRGAEVDRLLDEAHAALVAAIVRLLHRLGWETRVEVSFNEYGERGSIDVVGWHAGRRALVVIEVKSELASIEGTVRPFGVKCRLAPKVVAEQFGWRPLVVGRVLVLPEQRSARRAVERHIDVLNRVLPERSRTLRSWLHEPAGSIAGIWFLSDVGDAVVTRNPSSLRRVRHAQTRPSDPATVGIAKQTPDRADA